MDDNIGSIILYIILAILGIVGSLNKSKKNVPGKAKPQRPGSFFDMGDTKTTVPPPVYKRESQSQPMSKPQPETVRPLFTFDAEEEGEYEEPYAGAFTDEGNRQDTLAESYNNEGSMRDTLAERFEKEGKMDDQLANAFAGEGVSSLASARIKTEENTISESEISKVAEYNYDEGFLDVPMRDDIDLKKAVIYSEILNRKEYAF